METTKITMESPASFKEYIEEINLIIKRVGEIVKDNAMLEKKKEINEIENKKEKEEQIDFETERLIKLIALVNYKESKEIKFLSELKSNLVKVMWMKFRIENIDNQFGVAKDLEYNEGTNIITIVKEEK